MLKEYLKLNLMHKGQKITGFCMRIQDDFHETYAVMVDGYSSFCIWMDDQSATWKISKHTQLENEAVNKIIYNLSIA